MDSDAFNVFRKSFKQFFSKPLSRLITLVIVVPSKSQLEFLLKDGRGEMPIEIKRLCPQIKHWEVNILHGESSFIKANYETPSLVIIRAFKETAIQIQRYQNQLKQKSLSKFYLYNGADYFSTYILARTREYFQRNEDEQGLRSDSQDVESSSEDPMLLFTLRQDHKYSVLSRAVEKAFVDYIIKVRKYEGYGMRGFSADGTFELEYEYDNGSAEKEYEGITLRPKTEPYFIGRGAFVSRQIL